jgi:hypothetical protein
MQDPLGDMQKRGIFDLHGNGIPGVCIFWKNIP